MSLHHDKKSHTWMWWTLFVLALLVAVAAAVWQMQWSPQGVASLQASVVSVSEIEALQPKERTEDPIEIPVAVFKQPEIVVQDTPTDEIVPYVQDLSMSGFANSHLEGTDFEVVRVLKDNEWYTRYEVRYVSNGTKISGVFLMPKKVQNPPLLLLNHGYFPVEEYRLGQGLKREQDFFAQRGFAVLHSDYRGHAFSDPNPDDRLLYDSSFGYAMDVVNGFYALKNSDFASQINLDQVGMLGHSMGGEISLDIITAFPGFADVVVLYAPASGKAWLNFDRWKRSEPYAQNTLNTFGTYVEDTGDWHRLSSDTYLDRIDVPLWVFHGDLDTVVPVAWSDDLVADLEALQKDVFYTIYPTEDHQFEQNFWDFAWEAERFFEKHLKK